MSAVRPINHEKLLICSMLSGPAVGVIGGSGERESGMGSERGDGFCIARATDARVVSSGLYKLDNLTHVRDIEVDTVRARPARLSGQDRPPQSKDS